MHIINVGRRTATKIKRRPHWIYYASEAYISAKTYTFALIKAFLWSATDGKGIAGLLMGVKDTRKEPNLNMTKSRNVLLVFVLVLVLVLVVVLFLDKSFALVELIRDSRFNSKNKSIEKDRIAYM